jgi:hypothetical protein
MHARMHAWYVVERGELQSISNLDVRESVFEFDKSGVHNTIHDRALTARTIKGNHTAIALHVSTSCYQRAVETAAAGQLAAALTLLVRSPSRVACTSTSGGGCGSFALRGARAAVHGKEDLGGTTRGSVCAASRW